MVRKCYGTIPVPLARVRGGRYLSLSAAKLIFMVKTILYIFGVIFALVGLMGFVSDPVLGIFEVDVAHNLIHLVTGFLFLVIAKFYKDAMRNTAQLFGIVYGVVAVVGFIMPQDSIFGIFEANLADDILHALVALILLYAGFMDGREELSAIEG